MINITNCNETEKDELISSLNKLSYELLIGKPYVSELDEPRGREDADGLPISDHERKIEKKKKRKKRNKRVNSQRE